MKMLKHFVVFSSILLFVNPLSAQQKSFKGMEALSQNNFGTALSLFKQDLNKHPLAAYYGLATYYQSAFALNADSAFYYLEIFDNGWELAEPKLKRKLAEQWAVSDLSITRHFYELATYELKFINASPSIEAYENYVLRYQQFFDESVSDDRFSSKFDFQELYQTAIIQRNAFAYDLAIKDGSANAMLVFIVQYPNALQQSEAQNRYNNLLYLERTQTGSEAALIDFIKGFPENPHVAEAWQRLYKLIEKQATLSAYEHFVRTYPEAPQNQEAWKQVYKIYMQEYSIARLESFKKAYPDYPDLEALQQDGALLFMVFYPWIENQKYGYINQEGKLLIACQYDEASPFYEGLAIVSKAGKFGLVNKRNESVLSFNYDDIQHLDNGQFLLEDSLGFHLLNMAGQFLTQTPMPYEEMAQYLESLQVENQLFTDSTLSVSPVETSQLPLIFIKNGKKGLKLNNKEILAPHFEEIAPFIGTYAIAKKKGKYGLIDAQGKTILAFEYNAIRFVAQMGFLIEQNELLGVFEPSKGIFIPVVYEAIKPFENQYVLVTKGGKDGLLNKEGIEILAAQYQRIARFDAQTLVLTLQDQLLYYLESQKIFISKKP
ncbi:MAG: hypothetical protein RLZZ65_1033 [Bacteroidota bacterium]|jgi:hypothetical protein